uniref:Uncharacterized protein n=1 Tax=Arundo donax TaxID=35708 RepID=A0A0A8ZN72_ARUDO
MCCSCIHMRKLSTNHKRSIQVIVRIPGPLKYPISPSEYYEMTSIDSNCETIKKVQLYKKD